MFSVIDAPADDRRHARRRWWPLVVPLCAVIVAGAVWATVATYGTRPAGLVPRAPRELVLSPFALGGEKGAIIAGMNEQLAANAVTTGEIIGPDYNVAALASQAPGRAAVTLRGP